MMQQNIVFVENVAGSLKPVTELLKNEGIDIYGFACFDAPEFALFRMVCTDAVKAEQVLSANGYMNRITQVIVIDMKDEVGSLDELLGVVAESNVSLDYVYTSFHRRSQIPVVILHSEELTAIENVLKNNGFRVVNSAEELQKD